MLKAAAAAYSNSISSGVSKQGTPPSGTAAIQQEGTISSPHDMQQVRAAGGQPAERQCRRAGGIPQQAELQQQQQQQQQSRPAKNTLPLAQRQQAMAFVHNWTSRQRMHSPKPASSNAMRSPTMPGAQPAATLEDASKVPPGISAVVEAGKSAAAVEGKAPKSMAASDHNSDHKSGMVEAELARKHALQKGAGGAAGSTTAAATPPDPTAQPAPSSMVTSPATKRRKTLPPALPSDVVLQRFLDKREKEQSNKRAKKSRHAPPVLASSTVPGVDKSASHASIQSPAPAALHQSEAEPDHAVAATAAGGLQNIARDPFTFPDLPQQDTSPDLVQKVQPQQVSPSKADMVLASTQQLPQQHPVELPEEVPHSCTPTAGATTRVRTRYKNSKHALPPTVWEQLQSHPGWRSAVMAAVDAFSDTLDPGLSSNGPHLPMLASGIRSYSAEHLWKGLINALGAFLWHLNAAVAKTPPAANVQQLVKLLVSNSLRLVQTSVPSDMTAEQWDKYQPAGVKGDWQWAALMLQHTQREIGQCKGKGHEVGPEHFAPFVTVLLSLGFHL